MILSKFSANLLSPQILFFCLGAIGSLLRCELEFAPAVSKTLSLLLLLSIGFKGGMALAESGVSSGVMASMGAAVCAAVLIPVWAFFALKKRFGIANAAGVAASFGAVSSVTFLTACGLLLQSGISFSGHMVAALALMDSPAILTSILLARRASNKDNQIDPSTNGWRQLSRDVLLNSSVFILIGSLAVGALCNSDTASQMKPLIENLFPAVLSVFLLDMGLTAGRKIDALRTLGRDVVLFAFGAPLVNAALGLGLAFAAGLSHGDAFLLVVLCASASYIAAPAALRSALPEANPGIYLTLALALVFPFNLILGLPLYRGLVEAVLP
jgi:hypothetical protein